MPAETISSRLRLYGYFCLSLFPLLFFPLFFPSLRLTYFAPYLVLICYRRSLLTALWHATFCGILLDLLSSSTLFGLTSVNYVFSTLFLYWQTRNFFEDKESTLPAMTLFFAWLSTLFQFILLGLFGCRDLFSWRWLATDFLLMPLLDAAYAYIGFSLPFHLYRWILKLTKSTSYSS